MKAAGLILAALVILGGVASLVHAHCLESKELCDGFRQYSEETPAPSGKLKCTIAMGGNKALGAAVLQVNVIAHSGEIFIPWLSAGEGFQANCDIYPDRPMFGRVRLPEADGVWGMDFEVFLHAHPSGLCDLPGHAVGFLTTYAIM